MQGKGQPFLAEESTATPGKYSLAQDQISFLQAWITMKNIAGSRRYCSFIHSFVTDS